MKKTLALNILLFSALIPGLSACISLQLGAGKIQKAQDVSYEIPPAPFVRLSTDVADVAWRNPGNGNTLTYLSDCQSSSDPSLELIQSEVLSGLQSLELKTSEKKYFDNREALNSLARGKMDGVWVRVELLIYKKNGCTFTLTYMGADKNFDKDRSHFEKFLGGFKAP